MDDFLVRQDLDAGRLIQPFDISIAHGSYWLVARNFDDLSESATAFVQWLTKQLNEGHADDKS